MDILPIQRAVIFGATGATGKPIAEELLRRGIKTRVASRNLPNLRRIFENLKVEPVAADFLDLEAAKQAADSCDVIFHCVGVPLESYPQHIAISRNTIGAMQATGAKSILVSSFWSYGPSQSNPVNETHRPPLVTQKERIRREQEELFQQAGSVVTLFPDFYGPGAEIGFANAAIRALAGGKTADWIGELDEPRELIYVPDVGFPLVELAHRKAAYGQRWNVAGPGAITPRQFLQIAATFSQKPLKVRTANEFILFVIGLFNSQVRAMKELFPLYSRPPILDSYKLRQLIGDYPVTPYVDGVQETIRWMKKSPMTNPA
jgi:nucleoside-diphosphate-sugar epimerase